MSQQKKANVLEQRPGIDIEKKLNESSEFRLE